MEYTKLQLRPIFSNSSNYCNAFGCILVPRKFYYTVSVIFIFKLISYSTPAVAAHLMFPLKTHIIKIMSFQLRRWRICALLIAIPGILAFIGMLYLPESAKWFLSKGNNQSAYNTLDQLFVKNKKRDLSSMGVTGVTQSRISEDSELTSWQRVTLMFKPPIGKPFMCNSVILSILFFVYVCGKIGSVYIH